MSRKETKISGQASSAGSDTLRLALLLIGPVLAIVAFPTGAMLVHTIGLSGRYWQALRLSSSLYAIGLVLFLFLEGEFRSQIGEEYRSLEVAVALVGLAGSVGFLADFVHVRRAQSLSDCVFIAAACGGALVRRRTDATRSLTFVAMACARLRRPLVYAFPPFVSVSVLLAVASLYCLVRAKLGKASTRVSIVLAAAAGMVGTAVGVYGFVVASRPGSPSGILIFTVAILFFGGGAVLRVVLGDNWWRARAKR